MKKDQLNESIIGRRAVGYDCTGQVVGTVIECDYEKNIVCLEYHKDDFYWFHYKAVRLLKKKQAPVYWVHSEAFNGVEVPLYKELPLFMGYPSKKHVRVKLVKIKDEK